MLNRGMTLGFGDSNLVITISNQCGHHYTNWNVRCTRKSSVSRGKADVVGSVLIKVGDV